MEDAKLTQKKQRLGALIDIDSGEAPERGAKVLESLVKEDPLDGTSLILLAKYRAGEKRNQEAEMLLQQAERIEASAYEAEVELAKLYVGMTRYRDAVKQLDKALKITPSESLKNYRAAVNHLAEAAE